MRIAIVGAGIAGRLLALALLQQKYQVSLFDECAIDDKRGCSFAAAGMLSPAAEIEQGNFAIYQLGIQSLTRWPSILASLSTTIPWQQQGSLVVAHPQNQTELQHFHHLLTTRLGEHCQAQWIDQTALTALEPDLSINGTQALFLPEEAMLSSEMIMDTLATQLQQQGIQWHAEQRVDQLSAYTIHSMGKQQRFDWIADCRGLGAQDHWSDLRAVRGELIHLHAPEVQLTRPIRLLHPRYRIYIVPRAKQQYLIGATEIESDDRSPISVRSCLELLSAAYSVHRGFAEARIIKTVTQCRPAFADNDPRVEMQPGLVRINGLYRHGFLLAPALVDQALAYIKSSIEETVSC